jgi:hypothetical protein
MSVVAAHGAHVLISSALFISAFILFYFLQDYRQISD